MRQILTPHMVMRRDRFERSHGRPSTLTGALSARAKGGLRAGSALRRVPASKHLHAASCCSPRPTRIPALPFCHAHLSGPRPLPRSYPQVLATIGDHLRRRRLDLGLLQRAVAERLGANPLTVTNWETGRTNPVIRFLPQIIRFLGYSPVPESADLGDRIRAGRRLCRLSQRRLAGS